MWVAGYAFLCSGNQKAVRIDAHFALAIGNDFGEGALLQGTNDRHMTSCLLLQKTKFVTISSAYTPDDQP
ncbi:hypothetical protein SprV_0501848100 [Sparganum proliferum]